MLHIFTYKIQAGVANLVTTLKAVMETMTSVWSCKMPPNETTGEGHDGCCASAFIPLAVHHLLTAAVWMKLGLFSQSTKWSFNSSVLLSLVWMGTAAFPAGIKTNHVVVVTNQSDSASVQDGLCRQRKIPVSWAGLIFTVGAVGLRRDKSLLTSWTFL